MTDRKKRKKKSIHKGGRFEKIQMEIHHNGRKKNDKNN